MIDIESLNQYIQLAQEMGAVNGKIIEPASVITAAWVRMKCQYGCDRYNLSLCCPPRTPTPQMMREILDGYHRALLVHCDRDGMITALVARLERALFLDGFYKAWGMGSGPCKLCKKCDLEVCKRPEDARPAMEACGIDVFATVRVHGFPVEVLKDRDSQQNRYGLVLID